MNIQAGQFLKIVPPEKRGKIPGPKALEIVQRMYCDPMTVRGFCPGQCQSCKEALLAAFNLECARNEQAVLTWRLKDQLAHAQERSSAPKIEKQKDSIGLPMPEVDPFETLLKEYEEQAKRS